MRGGKRHRAALTEMIEDRYGQGCTLVRIGARADLIQQDQCILIRGAHHGLDVSHVSRKRAEVLLDRLLIANIGQHAFEKG